MNVSTWLVIELDRHGHPRVTKALQRRPRNEMAVYLTLHIEPDALQPHVEAMVDAGLIHLSLEEANEVVGNNVTG